MNLNRNLYKISFLFVVVFSMLHARPILAGEGTPTPSDDAVNAVAKQMYCPVCENIPLDVCGTTACSQWRDLIREKLSQGWSEEQIKTYFVQQYGDRVLATPPVSGGLSLNWLVYVVPILVFLVAVYIFAGVLRSWRGAPGGSAGTPPASSSAPSNPAADEYRARLEDELRRK